MTDPTKPEAPKHSTIVLTLTPDSKKIHGYGFVPETKTLAVRFKDSRDMKPGIYTYEYPNYTAEMLAELEKAESKGGHINKTLVFTKWPFTKLLAEAPAAPAAPEAAV